MLTQPKEFGANTQTLTYLFKYTVFMVCLSVQFDGLGINQRFAVDVSSHNIRYLLTLTVEHTLHHLLEAHHVDELTVGSRRQEVQERGWGFGWRDLQ